MLHHRTEREVVRLALKQPAQREHLVHAHAKREHVDAAIEPAAAQLLGGHVRVLALDRAGLRVRRRVLDLRDAEVEHLRDTRIGDEDVAGRDVAVNDADRFAAAVTQLVRVVKGVGDLLHHARHEPELELPHLLALLAQERQERHSLQVLHDDVQLAIGLAELVDLADVRVRELRCQPRLGDQHLAEPRVIGEVRQDPFDHEQLFEARSTLQPCEEDLAHAAGREPREQLVASQALRCLDPRNAHPNQF